MAIASALALALAPVTQAEPCPSSSLGCGQQLPQISIHSAGNILRGQTGSFVLASVATTSAITGSPASGMYVNFKVGGTAVAGVDYTALVSPAYMGAAASTGAAGYGVILVKTLPDPRAGSANQAYSVLVTLEPGPGYAVGQPSSALIWITTSCAGAACW